MSLNIWSFDRSLQMQSVSTYAHSSPLLLPSSTFFFSSASLHPLLSSSLLLSISSPLLSILLPLLPYLYDLILLFDVGVVLDKKTEILDMMIKHGIMDGLCEIFSTCQDEDILVCIDKFLAILTFFYFF